MRARSGEIDLDGTSSEAGNYCVVVGDQVATRRNDRSLRTDRGLMVKNRDHWDVVDVHRDGALTVAGPNGEVRLPNAYVRDHVELSYAETSHANQGRTVDRSFLLLDGPTGTRGVYVPMTRGRRSNEAFVVLEGEQTAADVVAESLGRDWIDQPAIARRAELQRSTSQASDAGSTQETLDPSALRSLIERSADLVHEESRAEADVAILTRQLDSNQQRRQHLLTSLEADRARLERALRIVEQFDRPMGRRRHRVEVNAACSQLQHLPASIERNRLELARLEASTVVDRRRLMAVEQTLRPRDELLKERLDLACRLKLDARARAASLREDPPLYVAERLGERSLGGASAALWDEAAGLIDQHRTAFGIEGASLLGPRPGRNDRAYAASHQATMDVIERLDRTVGRSMVIEPPTRELGLGL